MKLAKYLAIVALLVVPFATQINAQTLQANVAGSSALWLEAGQGAYNAAGPNCSWTSSASGVTYAQEQRPVGGFPENQENGNLWVIWTPGTIGGTCAAPDATSQVWAYINLDSTLGDRCLFAVPSCTLNTTAVPAGPGFTPGANLLTGITDVPTGMPASVLAAFNGLPITIAATDILPVDAKFATYSTLAACGPLSSGTQYTGYGYGPGPVGSTINSFYSTKNYHVIDFNVYGTDPITFGAVLPYTVTPVGASPVVVAVNTTNTSVPAMANATNVNRAVLGLIFGGIFARTADLLPPAPFIGTAGPYAGLTALIREPLSGTYNTFEKSIPNNKEIYRSQESGNCGANGTFSVTSNPMNLTRTVGGTSGFKRRVIGTGEMVKEIGLVQDSIGYAFWSAANFASAPASSVKYLTVDGVDPLQTTYTGGTIPQSGNGLLANVNLSHVADGSYPIWSELRFVSLNNANGSQSAANVAAATLASYAQATSTTPGGSQPDFITAPNLNVFHAHFAPPNFFSFNAGNVPSDGTRVCGPNASPEDGGDVGGLVFTIQAGADYCVLKGNYNVAGSAANPSGPTSSASFGSHQ
jgi:hypothetical protein